MTTSVLFRRAALLSLLYSPLIAFCAPGDLDTTFGTGGITAPEIPGTAVALATQVDGRIVVVGSGNGGVWTVARYKHNGTLDQAFSGDGLTSISPSVGGSEGTCAVAIQPDGKIVIGGSAIANSFGRRDFAVARLNADGSLDNTFSGDGVVLTRAERDEHGYLTTLVVQPDGRILAVGEIPSFYGTQLVRYMPDGTLDSSFGSGGITMPGYGTSRNRCKAITLQPNGRILLASEVEYYSKFGVGRLLENGNPDPTFSSDGWVTCDFVIGNEYPEAISVQQNGIITISGSARTTASSKTDYAVMRLLPDGDFDVSFSGGGKTIIPVESIPGMTQAGDKAGPWHVLRPDGKILLGGWYPKGNDSASAACLTRLDSSGELDLAFSGDGFAVVVPFGNEWPYSSNTRALVAQPDGKVLALIPESGFLRVARFIADEDSDGDGADDPTEVAKGTNPNDRDSDDDGLEDGPELAVHRSNPMDSDTDDDGLLDGVEVNQHHTSPLLADSDSDGLGDYAEVMTYGTNPATADSDGDGLTDPAEIQTHLTNPNIADSDSDGLSDGAEVNTHGTNPKVGDSDNDGFLDGYEVLTGKLPLDPLSKPALVAEARTAIEFVFPAAIGKTYRIEDSTDLVTWGTVESSIVGTGGQVQRFYSILNVPKRYFRVEEDTP